MQEILAALAANGDTLGVGLMLVAVLGFFLRQLASGGLVFRRTLDDLRDSTRSEIERTIVYYDKLVQLKAEQADAWHTAYQNEAIARADQGATLAEQLELARAANHMLQALPTSRPGGTAIGGSQE